MLKEALSKRVGYIDDCQCEDDRCLVEQLFEAGKVQVVVVSSSLVWEVNLTAHMVVILDTQHFNWKISAYEDFPIEDLLQMVGRANRPLLDSDSECFLASASECICLFPHLTSILSMKMGM